MKKEKDMKESQDQDRLRLKRVIELIDLILNYVPFSEEMTNNTTQTKKLRTELVSIRNGIEKDQEFRTWCGDCDNKDTCDLSFKERWGIRGDCWAYRRPLGKLFDSEKMEDNIDANRQQINANLEGIDYCRDFMFNLESILTNEILDLVEIIGKQVNLKDYDIRKKIKTKIEILNQKWENKKEIDEKFPLPEKIILDAPDFKWIEDMIYKLIDDKSSCESRLYRKRLNDIIKKNNKTLQLIKEIKPIEILNPIEKLEWYIKYEDFKKIKKELGL
jgi:hypothetical protein